MALQIVQIPDLVNSVIHNTPDLVVDQIKVWTIRRPQLWRDKCRCVTFQETDGVMCRVCRGTFLLQNEDGVVDKTLLYTSPHVNQTPLQIVQILDLCLLNSLLHNVRDLVVDRVKVRVIRRN